MKIPTGREVMEEAFGMDALYKAIGKFIFLFSQLEFTIRHGIMECLKLKEELGDAVTAPYDFVGTCRVADRLLKERHHGKPEVVQEIDKMFKECLKLNEQRVRIVHGSWIFGSSAWHTSRTTLQSTEYFKTTEDVVREIERVDRLMTRVGRVLRV